MVRGFLLKLEWSGCSAQASMIQAVLFKLQWSGCSAQASVVRGVLLKLPGALFKLKWSGFSAQATVVRMYCSSYSGPGVLLKVQWSGCTARTIFPASNIKIISSQRVSCGPTSKGLCHHYAVVKSSSVSRCPVVPASS